MRCVIIELFDSLELRSQSSARNELREKGRRCGHSDTCYDWWYRNVNSCTRVFVWKAMHHRPKQFRFLDLFVLKCYFIQLFCVLCCRFLFFFFYIVFKHILCVFFGVFFFTPSFYSSFCSIVFVLLIVRLLLFLVVVVLSEIELSE